jgi:hypothetical protein
MTLAQLGIEGRISKQLNQWQKTFPRLPDYRERAIVQTGAS